MYNHLAYGESETHHLNTTLRDAYMQYRVIALVPVLQHSPEPV